MLAILAAVMLAAAPQHDTVFTADGGRVVGTVVEEGPQGIAVRLIDGTFRRFARRDVLRIEYADGTVSTIRPAEPPPSPPPQQQPAPPPPPSSPPPPYPPPAYPPPPRYAPPPHAPPPPPRAYPPQRVGPSPWAGAPISPVYLSFGLGAAFPSGEIADTVDMRDVFGNQVDFAFEGGLRLTPHLAVALYADIAGGDAARSTRNEFCDPFDCDASTWKVGLLLRHTFSPAARTTPWIAAGTGWEGGSVSFNDDFDDELFSYSGWEVLRLMGGVDLRTNPVFGFGLYGGVAFGRYSRGEDALGSFDIDRERFHTTVQAGVRLTLFP